MALNTLEYLNLSAIAYLDIDKLSIGKDIAQLIEDKVISEKTLTVQNSLPSKIILTLVKFYLTLISKQLLTSDLLFPIRPLECCIRLMFKIK